MQPIVRSPILWDVDVLVVGATTGAVAAALAAARTGRRVALVSELSYLGAESAGRLRLVPGAVSEHPLFRRCFAPGGGSVPTPLQIKHALETELLEASIPFLYLVRPVALLRDEADSLAGVLIAARASLFAIRCRRVIDATPFGTVARLARAPVTPRASPRPVADWIVLAQEAPRPEPPNAFDVGPTGTVWGRFATPSGEITVHTFRLRFPSADPGATIPERAGWEHRLKSRVLDGNVVYAADLAGLPCPDVVAGPLVASPDRLSDPAFAAAPGVFLLNGLLPVDGHALGDLDEPAVQIALGERVGELAARSSAAPPPARGPLRVDTGAPGRGGDFDFDPPFIRPGDAREWLELSWPAVPELGRCDVLVAGGGTAGAPAAIAAARAGARTILVEPLHGLGGVGTLGYIAAYHFGNRVGFTAEVDAAVSAIQRVRFSDKPGAWSPETKIAWYQRALREAGGSAWFGSFAFGVLREGDRVAGLLISTPFGSGLLRAHVVIDAGGNADLAAAAGAPTRWVTARHVAVQGTGLSPRQLAQHYSNTDHTFVDDSDPFGVTHAFVQARRMFPDEFDVSTLVNSRERRRIVGEYELTPLDILAHRTFPDTITVARSNFDSHGFVVHPVFLIVPPDKEPLTAAVPFRCLLPRGVEGLLVVGLGLSAHRDALPVVRMQADVQNHGYAAGLAAAMAARENRRLRELDLRALQRQLVDVGILPPETPGQTDSFPLPEETIRDCARRGPVDHFHAAVIFAHPDVSVPILRGHLGRETDPQLRECSALALGLMGDGAACPVLTEIVRSRGWDRGWNFRGMGQFGFSSSRMDALVIALGWAAAAEGVDPAVRAAAREALREKIEALDENSEFSHVRAVSVAAGALGDPKLAEPLARLLEKPGLHGHAQTDLADAIRTVPRVRNDNTARNLALKEIYLARGLYLCGDRGGLGRRTLETYARDLRGPFARHAAAVLAERDLDRLRREAI